MKKNLFTQLAIACFTIISFSSVATAQDETGVTPEITFEVIPNDTIVAVDTTVTVKVSGVTCGGDLPVICKYVQQEKGIIEIKSVGKPGAVSTFEVKYNPALITYEQVISKLEDSPSCDAPKTKPFKVKKNS